MVVTTANGNGRRLAVDEAEAQEQAAAPVALPADFAADLVAALAEMPDLPRDQTATVRGNKDGKSYSYDYKYTSLALLLKTVRPVLGAHGIVATFRPIADQSVVGAQAMLVHRSGAVWAAPPMVRSSDRMSTQDVGGVQSYYRRYSIQALLGLAAEEDTDAANVDHREGQSQRAPQGGGNGARQRPAGNGGNRAAAAPAPQAGLQGKGQATVNVERVTKRDGETNGRPWVLHIVATDKGDLATFSDTLAEKLRQATGPVQVEYEANARGVEVMGIVEPAAAADPAPAPAPAAAPADPQAAALAEYKLRLAQALADTGVERSYQAVVVKEFCAQAGVATLEALPNDQRDRLLTLATAGSCCDPMKAMDAVGIGMAKQGQIIEEWCKDNGIRGWPDLPFEIRGDLLAWVAKQGEG